MGSMLKKNGYKDIKYRKESQKQRIYGLTAVLCSLLSFCIFLTTGVSASAAPHVQQEKSPIVIVIDPGHSGDNLGTTENGFLEKSMNMVTALAMYEELIRFDDVTVYLTHTEDVGMTLEERAVFAKEVDADFLFSIHYNASLEHTLFGSEVWISCQPPLHAYGYQFGYVHQQIMQDMGLFSRGVKTRIEKKRDYYGILRESAARDIPAVIIEHCHVDESRDSVFCENEEKLKAFGRADALAVAKYFGLKSSATGADYSAFRNELPAVNEEGYVQMALRDETAPDVCQIELVEARADKCELDLRVTAADYDTPLIYYSYSLDGGNTFCALQPWPESNALTGAYKDTFLLQLSVPEGTRPDVVVRAYNLSDACTESNELNLPQVFQTAQAVMASAEPASDKGEADDSAEAGEDLIQEDSTAETGEESQAVLTFQPAAVPNGQERDKTASFGSFLLFCVLLAALVFLTVLVYQGVRNSRRRRRK